MSVLDTFCVFACVGSWGVDGGWTPLPIRPQRFFEPMSLIDLNITNGLMDQMGRWTKPLIKTVCD